MKTNLCDHCKGVAMPFVSLSVQVHHKPDAASVTSFRSPIELCRACATQPIDLRALAPTLEETLLKGTD